MMNYAKFLTNLVFLIPVSGYAASVEFEIPARVRQMDSDKLELFNTGQKLDLKNGQAYVVLPDGQLPWLFFSPTNSSSSIKVSAAQTASVYQSLMQPVLDRQLNEILSEVNQVQALIQKRDFSSAIAQAARLKEKYPKLATAYFLSGTANFMANNKNLANEELKKGLAIDPSNDWAKTLQEKLQKGER